MSGHAGPTLQQVMDGVSTSSSSSDASTAPSSAAEGPTIEDLLNPRVVETTSRETTSTDDEEHPSNGPAGHLSSSETEHSTSDVPEFVPSEDKSNTVDRVTLQTSTPTASAAEFAGVTASAAKALLMTPSPNKINTFYDEPEEVYDEEEEEVEEDEVQYKIPSLEPNSRLAQTEVASSRPLLSTSASQSKATTLPLPNPTPTSTTILPKANATAANVHTSPLDTAIMASSLTQICLSISSLSLPTSTTACYARVSTFLDGSRTSVSRTPKTSAPYEFAPAMTLPAPVPSSPTKDYTPTIKIEIVQEGPTNSDKPTVFQTEISGEPLLASPGVMFLRKFPLRSLNSSPVPLSSITLKLQALAHDDTLKIPYSELAFSFNGGRAEGARRGIIVMDVEGGRGKGFINTVNPTKKVKAQTKLFAKNKTHKTMWEDSRFVKKAKANPSASAKIPTEPTGTSCKAVVTLTITGETLETEYAESDINETTGTVKWEGGRGLQMSTHDVAFDVVRVKVLRVTDNGDEEEVGRRDVTVRKIMAEDTLSANIDDHEQLKVTRWRAIHKIKGSMGAPRGIPSRSAGEVNIGGIMWRVEEPEEEEEFYPGTMSADIFQAPPPTLQEPPPFATTMLQTIATSTREENEHMKALLEEPHMHTGAISVKVVGIAYLKGSGINGRLKVRTKLEPGGWNAETNFKGKMRPKDATLTIEGYTRVGEGARFKIDWSARETKVPYIGFEIFNEEEEEPPLKASIDISSIVRGGGRATEWIIVGDESAAIGVDLVYTPISESNPKPVDAHGVEERLSSSLPSGFEHLSSRMHKTARRGGFAGGSVHIELMKYITVKRRREGHRSPLVPRQVCAWIGICNGAGGAIEGGETVTAMITDLGDGVNLNFGGKGVLLPLRDPGIGRVVKVEIRDGEDEGYRVLAEGTIHITDQVIGGKGLTVRPGLQPMTMGKGEKVGYLQAQVQFLPGQASTNQATVAKKETSQVPPAAEKKAIAAAVGPTLRVKVEGARDLRCPGWPGRKEPYVEVDLVAWDKNEDGRRIMVEGGKGITQLADTKAAGHTEGGLAEWGEVLKLSIPPCLMLGEAKERETEETRGILVVKMRGGARIKHGEPAVIGECRVPVPWEVIRRGKRKSLWCTIREGEEGEGAWEVGNPNGGTGGRRGEVRLTLSSEGVVNDAIDGFQDEDDFEAMDEFESEEESEDEAPVEKKKLNAGNGPGLLVVQVTNLEISRNGERMMLKPKSIELGFNGTGKEDSDWVGADNVNPNLPSELYTQSPSKAPKGSKMDLLARSAMGEDKLTFEINEDVANHSRPVCMPVPFFKKGANVAVKVLARSGMAFYNTNLDASTVMAAHGQEIEEWTPLNPVMEPITGLQVGDTPEKGVGRPAFGRARLNLRYVPHTAGTVKINVRRVVLSEHIGRIGGKKELFVRARIVPGGEWATTKVMVGDHKRDSGMITFNEMVRLPIDTTKLPVREGGVAPGVELTLFDNKPGVLYNVIGKGILPLPAVLCKGFEGVDGLDRKSGDAKRIILLDSLSGKGGGLDCTDVVKDAGGIDVVVDYSHERIPTSAMGGEEDDDGENIGIDRVLRIASAESKLKGLFWKLEEGGKTDRKKLMEIIGDKRQPWGRLLAELRGVKVVEEGGDVLATNAAEEIGRVFELEGASDGHGLKNERVSWEEWLAYLETLRVNGWKNGGGVDVGVVRRNLMAARGGAEGGGDAVKVKVKDGEDIEEILLNDMRGGLGTMVVEEEEVGRSGRRITEGPPSSPARGNYLGMSRKGARKRKSKSSEIDPISGLPCTESDYKRMDAEDNRNRLQGLQKEMMMKEAGIEVEELKLKNARLRVRLKSEIDKRRHLKASGAVRDGRAKRLLNAEIELAVLAKGGWTGGETSTEVYGITGVGGGVSNDTRVVHLEEVNSMLRRTLKRYQAEWDVMVSRVKELEDVEEDAVEQQKGEGGSEEKLAQLSERQVESELEKSRLGMQMESMKVENSQLRTEKLTLARRASRAVEAERTANAGLAIERKRSDQLTAELERARQVIAAHEREALHRNAEQKLAVLAAARERARREADSRSKLAVQKAQDEASRVLQNRVKGWKAKREFMKEKESVVKVQSVIRSAGERMKFKARLKRESSAASVLQRRIRGTKIRTTMKQHRIGVIPIQALWRRAFVRVKMGLVVKMYKRGRVEAATRIQGCRRSQLGVSRFREIRTGVVKVQGLVRGRREAKEWKRKLDAVMVLQSCLRMSRGKMIVKEKMKESATGDLRVGMESMVGEGAEEEYEILVGLLEKCKARGVGEDDEAYKKGLERKENMEMQFSALEALVVVCLGGDMEKIKEAIQSVEDLGCGVGDERLVRGYRKLQDLEIEDAVKKVEVAVGDGNEGKVVGGLIEEATSLGASDSNPVLKVARKYVEDMKKERERSKMLKELRKVVKAGTGLMKGAEWERDIGEDWDRIIRGCVAKIKRAIEKVGEGGGEGVDEGKRVMEKLEKGRERERERAEEKCRIKGVVEGARGRVRRMDEEEREEVEGLMLKWGPEEEGGKAGLKDMMTRLEGEVRGRIMEVEGERERAVELDELETVTKGKMWAVEDDLKKRLRGLAASEASQQEEVKVEEEEVKVEEEEVKASAKVIISDHAAKMIKQASANLVTDVFSVSSRSAGSRGSSPMKKEGKNKEKGEEKDKENEEPKTSGRKDKHDDKASRARRASSSMVTGIIQSVSPKVAKTVLEDRNAKEKSAVKLQAMHRKKSAARKVKVIKEEKDMNVAATKLQAVAKGKRVRLDMHKKMAAFSRSSGQPEGEEGVGWEVEVTVESEEVDQHGNAEVVRTKHLGFVSKYHPFENDGVTVRDEVSVVLYDNAVNRELAEAEVEGDDEEDEEDEEGGKKLDLTEVCKAGGNDIEYLVKRPVGSETFEDGGGWEVEVMMHVGFEGEEGAENKWVRGYVHGYNPYDDVIKVRFYNDGDMTEMLEALVEDGEIKSEGEFEEIFGATGKEVRYLRVRPAKVAEGIERSVRAYVEVGTEDDGEGGEEGVYDWVEGRVKEIKGSKDDEEVEVYVIEGEEGENWECDVEDKADIQF